MSPSDGSASSDADESDGPQYVFCRSCGTKASADWSFCRSCESSLDDAIPSNEKESLLDTVYGDQSEEGDAGCPKCGHTEAEARLVETTGVDVLPRIPASNDRFRVVSCGRCGYCEFYDRGDPELLVDLFFER